MMAYSVADMQRKLQTLGTIGIIVGAAFSLVVVGPVLGGGSSASPVALYNVTFVMANGTAEGAGGSAAFYSTVDAMVEIPQRNLTFVTFHVSYVDNSISPLFNPAVNVNIVGPAGSGTTSGQVGGGSAPTDFPIGIQNEVPANATVQAPSAEAAINESTPDDLQASLGMGTWTITVDVGAPLAGRIRPSGTITYTISVDVMYYEGAAAKA